jgi:HlyD family secretion protein
MFPESKSALISATSGTFSAHTSYIGNEANRGLPACIEVRHDLFKFTIADENDIQPPQWAKESSPGQSGRRWSRCDFWRAPPWVIVCARRLLPDQARGHETFERRFSTPDRGVELYFGILVPALKRWAIFKRSYRSRIFIRTNAPSGAGTIMTNAEKKSRKRRRWIYLGILLVCLVGGILGINAALRPNNQIDPSKLATIERGNIVRSVVATGKIEPKAKVEVKSKASGIVKQIFVHYGDYVKQAQILVELDKEELQARVRETRANLLAAQAAQESAHAAHERNQVEAEGPDLPFLKAGMERARSLHREGLISKSLVEDAEKAYQLALNKQMVALRNVGVTRAEMAKAKAQVAQAQALLERSEEDLRNSTIVSPMNGLVLSRNVEVGDAVSSILVLGSQATLIMVLGDVSDVYVLGKVDEADIGKVYFDQPARIVVESFKEKKFEGKVTKISPLGVEKDNVTTFEVRVSIRNFSGELKANMSANAEIILEEKQNVLLVPESAVIYDKDRHASIEVPDLKAEKGRRKVAVKLGISNGVKTELASGLTEGHKVILQ